MTMRAVVSLAVVVPVLGAAVFATAGAAAATSGRASSGGGSSSSVKIVTDAAGIPHITASNFRSLGYGEAWAFAQDNFCTLANDFVTVNGERSQYFGPNNLAINYS